MSDLTIKTEFLSVSKPSDSHLSFGILLLKKIRASLGERCLACAQGPKETLEPNDGMKVARTFIPLHP